MLKHNEARKEAELVQLRAFAERVASLHYWVATNVNADISAYTSNPYNQTQSLVKSAIRHAYPELDKLDLENVYEAWVDCGESIAYCVQTVKELKADIARENALGECAAGHVLYHEKGEVSEILARHAACTAPNQGETDIQI